MCIYAMIFIVMQLTSLYFTSVVQYISCSMNASS